MDDGLDNLVLLLREKFKTNRAISAVPMSCDVGQMYEQIAIVFDDGDVITIGTDESYIGLYCAD